MSKKEMKFGKEVIFKYNPNEVSIHIGMKLTNPIDSAIYTIESFTNYGVNLSKLYTTPEDVWICLICNQLMDYNYTKMMIKALYNKKSNDKKIIKFLNDVIAFYKKHALICKECLNDFLSERKDKCLKIL